MEQSLSPERRIVVVARWLPDLSPAASLAARLAVSARDQGWIVEAWGLPGDVLATRRLSCQTRARSREALAEIDRSPAPRLLVLFLGPILRGGRGWGERLRRLLVLHRLARRSGEVALAMPATSGLSVLSRLALVLFVLRLRLLGTRVRAVPQPALGRWIAAGPRVGAPLRGQVSVVDLVRALAPMRAAGVPLSSDALLEAGGPAATVLSEIVAIAQSPRLIARRAADRRGRASALTPSAGEGGAAPEEGVIPYLAHLAEVFRVRRPPVRLLNWYLDAAADRLPDRARPILPEMLSALSAGGAAPVQGPPHPRSDALAAAFDALLAAPVPHPDPALRDWLRAPVEPGRPMTRGGVVAALHLGWSPPDPVGPAPWRHPALADWLRLRAGRHHPGLHLILPRRRALSQPPTLSIVGGRGETGLDRNTAMSEAALGALGLSGPQAAKRLTAPVMLYHLNADRLPRQIFQTPGPPGAYRIGFLLWEFPVIPAAHRMALRMLDEIWVPTTFVAEAYRAVTTTPVHVVGKGIALPDPPSGGAPHPLREGPFHCLMAFDAPSGVERKNPLAALRAFQHAFPGDPDVRLTIKATPVKPGHWGDPHDQMDAVRRAVTADPRVTLVEHLIPFTDLLTLVRGADCLISPHRAEGFGYLPAYAMALGTPVVATDHGGPRDYLSPETGWPVPSPLVPVTASPLDCPGAVWADVDPAALAESLRRVRADPGEAARRARAAREAMARDWSLSAQTARYAARLGASGLLLGPVRARASAPDPAKAA